MKEVYAFDIPIGIYVYLKNLSSIRGCSITYVITSIISELRDRDDGLLRDRRSPTNDKSACKTA